MDRICPDHRGLSADHGTCAPLHVADERTREQREYAATARRAERMASALTTLAECYRLAAWQEDSGDERGAAITRANGRAALHLFPELQALTIED